MTRTATLLLTGALALAGSLAAASPATAAPACNTVSAGAVHSAETAVEPTPAGPLTTSVIHNVVEPATCRLP